MKNAPPILQHAELFAGLSGTEITSVMHCLKAVRRNFSNGAFLFHADEPIQMIGVVLSGSLLLTQEDRWGRRNILSEISPGMIFGEAFAVANDHPLDMNIIAKGEVEVLFLNVHRILKTCQSPCRFHTRVIHNLLQILSQRLLAFHAKITHMGRKNTREKILSFLSSEAKRRKTNEFDLNFNRQQMADYLCVERAAMSVELNKLRKDGFLECHRGHFKLLRHYPTSSPL